MLQAPPHALGALLPARERQSGRSNAKALVPKRVATLAPVLHHAVQSHQRHAHAKLARVRLAHLRRVLQRERQSRYNEVVLSTVWWERHVPALVRGVFFVDAADDWNQYDGSVAYAPPMTWPSTEQLAAAAANEERARALLAALRAHAGDELPRDLPLLRYSRHLPGFEEVS